MITSPHNSRLRNVAKLRDRRPRKQQGLMLIDGARQIERALAAGLLVQELYYPQPAELEPLEQQVLQGAEAAGVELLPVAKQLFPKVAYGDRELGMVAVAKTPAFELARLQLPAHPLVLVVERIEKPGNLGAMLRTADAVGCQALLVADALTDLANPNVVRASMGALFTVPVAQAESREVRDWLLARNFQLFAARVEGAIEYTAASYRGSVAMVLGSEAEGLSEVWQGDRIEAIRLPMHGAVDSLNVSVTAAVLLYEAQRQRRSQSA